MSWVKTRDKQTQEENHANVFIVLLDKSLAGSLLILGTHNTVVCYLLCAEQSIVCEYNS